MKRFLKTTVHFICIVLFLALMAILLTWFLQYKYYEGNTNETCIFFSNYPEIFWYGALVIFVVLAFGSSVTGRPCIIASLAWAAGVAASFANTNKLALRSEPLYPEDLQMLGATDTLTDFVDENALTRVITAVVLILVLGLVLNCAAHKIWKFDKSISWWRRHAILQRIILSVLLGAGIINLVQPLYDLKDPRHNDFVNNLHLTIVSWNQPDTYKASGFLMGFLINFGELGIEQPSGYNETTIRRLADKYNNDLINDTSDNLTDIADNVIVVLAESFYDPSLVEAYIRHSGGDVTPNLHKIMHEHSSGYMYSPLYGGGTANAEAEVFSGLTNYWAEATLYSDVFSKKSVIPSVATYTRNNGFGAVAIHSYTGTLYKRGTALNREGFERFITIDDMKHQEIYEGSRYPSDQAAYQETLDYLREHDGKQTIGLITMQNHTPYFSAAYAKLQFKIKAGDPADPDTIEGYYQTLHDSDKALGDFISELDAFDEKTVVLWYGDHSGGVYGDLREQGKEMEDLTQQTPYFVYTNFNIAKQNLPTTTPNCLVNTMYNVIGVQKPTMGYLLDKVCAETPILTDTYLRGETPEYTEALKDYQMVNYDLMVGNQYWLKYAKAY